MQFDITIDAIMEVQNNVYENVVIISNKLIFNRPIS